MNETPPDHLYLEQWPEAAQRGDRIHYEETGYGDDLRGHTSTITAYVREDLAAQPTAHTARVAFKRWDVAEQRSFLHGLLNEHAYYCGAALEHIPEWFPPLLQAEYKRGVEHAHERRQQFETGERGALDGGVTWDFVDTDVGLSDEQLERHRSECARLCAATDVVNVSAYDGEYSDGEPVWIQLYLRDPVTGEDTVSVGTIQCPTGRPTHPAILAALAKWRPGVPFLVTREIFRETP